MLNVSNPGGGKAATDASMNNNIYLYLILSLYERQTDNQYLSFSLVIALNTRFTAAGRLGWIVKWIVRTVAIWGEPCACIDLDTERREKEKDASYI